MLSQLSIIVFFSNKFSEISSEVSISILISICALRFSTKCISQNMTAIFLSLSERYRSMMMNSDNS